LWSVSVSGNWGWFLPLTASTPYSWITWTITEKVADEQDAQPPHPGEVLRDTVLAELSVSDFARGWVCRASRSRA